MKFQQILADPGWFYNDRRLIRRDNSEKKAKFGIGVHRRYRTMKTEDLAALPVEDLAAKVCHLHLWTTCTHLPDAIRVMGAWGFRFKTVEYVWVKLNRGRYTWSLPSAIKDFAEWISKDQELPTTSLFLRWLTFFGPGFYTGSNIELVLLGTTKKVHTPVNKAIRQLIFAPVSEIHSRKPYAVHKGIEAQYPNQRYVELFATEERPGWTCLGDAIDGRDLKDSILSLVDISDKE